MRRSVGVMIDVKGTVVMELAAPADKYVVPMAIVRVKMIGY